NREMYKLYSSLLKESVSNIISERIELLLQGLITGKDDIVRKYLQEFIINAMSMHDVPAGRTAIPERSYHLFILGMLVILEGRYYVQSNRESGIGRYDIMLIPSNPAKDAGIVIEFKSKRERETLQEAAQKALDQIIEKQYAAQLQAKGCSTVYHYGIGFEGKELALVMT
ncbi:AAA family ATPase, partial [Candidatus Dependentiae bacterium]|nr:AAA family ATPase [Candidatus Dependentiae bacterium]